MEKLTRLAKKFLSFAGSIANGLAQDVIKVIILTLSTSFLTYFRSIRGNPWAMFLIGAVIGFFLHPVWNFFAEKLKYWHANRRIIDDFEAKHREKVYMYLPTMECKYDVESAYSKMLILSADYVPSYKIEHAKCVKIRFESYVESQDPDIFQQVYPETKPKDCQIKIMPLNRGKAINVEKGKDVMVNVKQYIKLDKNDNGVEVYKMKIEYIPSNKVFKGVVSGKGQAQVIPLDCIIKPMDSVEKSFNVRGYVYLRARIIAKILSTHG